MGEIIRGNQICRGLFPKTYVSAYTDWPRGEGNEEERRYDVREEREAVLRVEKAIRIIRVRANDERAICLNFFFNN